MKMVNLLSKFKNILSKLTVQNLVQGTKNFAQKTKETILFIKFFISEFIAFYVLITLHLLDVMVVTKLITSKYLPHFFIAGLLRNFSAIYSFFRKRLDRVDNNSISKLDLIQLSIRNMKVKKTRTLITIGGVSIGIAAIVFLVSLGYGLQKLVVSRVARLDELKQADVSTQPGSKLKIDDKTLTDVKNIPEVEDVYPLIAVVGRVNYQNSISDMAVYGVTTKYLEKSAVKPVKGKIFESHNLSLGDASGVSNSGEGQVAGASVERKFGRVGKKIADIEYSIYPQEWVRVRSGPSVNDTEVGYTKRESANARAEAYYGSKYNDPVFGNISTTESGVDLGLWVKSKVALWKIAECDSKSNADCVENKYKVARDNTGAQIQTLGYFAASNLNILDAANLINDNKPAVLGDSTTVFNQDVLAADSAVESTGAVDPLGNIKLDDTSNYVEIVESSDASKDTVAKLAISPLALKQAVVNRAMLKLLNIPEDEAVGKTFSVSFVIPAELLSNSEKRVESESTEYSISGVTPDEASAVFYVPFADLRSLGVTNFTQFKVGVKEPEGLDKVRKQIESIGYATQSVVDTVAQINSLFETIRFVLGIVGMVALAVASLGMFNTLTISLLERSREVGLMKAMGMKTSEVQELFLTESIIMGFCAGLVGLAFGFIGGKLLGLILTFFAIFKGQGFIDVTYIPFQFVTIIMVLSIFVGMVTGIYPAKRSKKISALDALRYE